MGARWALGSHCGAAPPASASMQEGGGLLWILKEEKEMQTGISSLFFAPCYFFPLVPAPGAGFLRYVVIRPYTAVAAEPAPARSLCQSLGRSPQNHRITEW